MDNALYYLALNRQRGLSREMTAIANNVANLDTPGFRRQGVVFSEFVHATRDASSVSMADAGARFADKRPGDARVTGGALDLALEGDGYFVLEGGDGPLLTRAGAFQRAADGTLVTPQGLPLLDDGEAPIVLPPDAERITVAPDGTVAADGLPLARVGVATAPAEALTRIGNTHFAVDGDLAPAAEVRIRQGMIEESNVDPVTEIARMIEVSRAYEQARTLIDDEDERIREVIRTLGQAV